MAGSEQFCANCQRQIINFVGLLCDNGGDLVSLQMIMGHKSMVTTSIYPLLGEEPRVVKACQPVEDAKRAGLTIVDKFDLALHD
jgi:hypothetical protein